MPSLWYSGMIPITESFALPWTLKAHIDYWHPLQVTQLCRRSLNGFKFSNSNSKNVYCHNVYKSGTNVWIIYTNINTNNSNTRATSYGKGSMKPNGFMGSISGNTSNNMILVGARVQRVQGNYHHFDNVWHRQKNHHREHYVKGLWILPHHDWTFS